MRRVVFCPREGAPLSLVVDSISTEFLDIVSKGPKHADFLPGDVVIIFEKHTARNPSLPFFCGNILLYRENGDFSVEEVPSLLRRLELAEAKRKQDWMEALGIAPGNVVSCENPLY